MAKTIYIKARRLENHTEIRLLFKHDMETGFRRDNAAGKIIEPHFIQEVYCEIGGEEFLIASWGPAISKDPYLKLLFREGAPNDVVRIRWVDNHGESDAAEAVIE